MGSRGFPWSLEWRGVLVKGQMLQTFFVHSIDHIKGKWTKVHVEWCSATVGKRSYSTMYICVQRNAISYLLSKPDTNHQLALRIFAHGSWAQRILVLRSVVALCHSLRATNNLGVWPSIFTEKTFVDRPKTSKVMKFFSLGGFPLYGTHVMHSTRIVVVPAMHGGCNYFAVQEHHSYGKIM